MRIFEKITMWAVAPIMALGINLAAAQTASLAVDVEKADPPPVESYEQAEVPTFGREAKQIGPVADNPEKDTVAYPTE